VRWAKRVTVNFRAHVNNLQWYRMSYLNGVRKG